MSNIELKIGVWRAIYIQKTRHLDLIVARAPLVADFIDSIDPKPTSSLVPPCSGIANAIEP